MPGIFLNPSGCCCEGERCGPCRFCPEAGEGSTCRNLSLFYTNVLTGAGSFLLVNTARCIYEGCSSDGRLWVSLDQDQSPPLLVARFFTGFDCPNGDYVECRTNLAPTSNIDATSLGCSPLDLNWRVRDVGPPEVVYCQILRNNGYLTLRVTE